MTLTPRATTDDNISAPTWRLILFPAAMSVYPFELDDSYPINAGFAHCCVRAAGGDAAASSQLYLAFGFLTMSYKALMASPSLSVPSGGWELVCTVIIRSWSAIHT